MRIGLTCTTIESTVAKGQLDGIGTYTKNLYEHLITRGENITPFSFSSSRKMRVSDFKQGKFFPFSYSFSTLASLLNPLPLTFYGNLKKHVDILHVTDHMLAKAKGIPIVATLCDALMFDPSGWHWDTIRLSHLKKWIRKKTVHWADHFITISHAMIPELVEYIGIPEEKISVIYLGIDEHWFHPASQIEKNNVLKKFNLPHSFLLFTGTLQHKKNLPRTIDAFLQLPSDIQDAFPLVIVGRPGFGGNESLAAIEKLQDKKKGRWLNYVTIDELRILFQCATAYLHPSLHEGFGLTLLEAFASQTPTITSNIKALPEIADDAALLVDPYSISDITQAIQSLLTSPNLQKTLVQKGLMRVKAFSWEACAEKTLKIYQSLL